MHSGGSVGSDIGFAEYVVDQLDPELSITYKRMFGEFGLYSDGRFFGLICDDQLFIKPTDAGRTFLGDDLVEAPAYPGAKPSFRIDALLEDPDRLSELVRITVDELFPEA